MAEVNSIPAALMAQALAAAEPGPTNAFPLSTGQERLWLLQQLQPHSGVYNIPQCWRLQGELDRNALGAAFQKLTARHETLRTRFVSRAGAPAQVIEKEAIFPLKYVELADGSVRQEQLRELLNGEARRPFALGTAPLARGTLIRLSEQEHIIVLVLHHLISDEWSFGVLLREVAANYAGFKNGHPIDFPELPIQFADYASWERGRAEAATKQVGFWKEKLSGELPLCTLPADFTPPATLKHEGTTSVRTLARELTPALKSLASRNGVTLFAALLTAFKALLHRWTCLEDIVVGTSFAERERLETEGLIGFLVQTAVLRTSAAGDPRYTELLQRVWQTVLEAQAHREVPLEAIVREVQPERTAGTNPLFRVFFALQPAAAESWNLTGLKTSRLELDNGGAKFDLALLVTDLPDGLKLRCEYSTELFERETIHTFLDAYERLLSGVASRPECRISEPDILKEPLLRQILWGWNDTATSDSSDCGIHALFEQQAALSPEAVALVDGDRSVTYHNLVKQAERAATRLLPLLEKPESRVALCVERSAEMVAAILGILKTGSAYVPLDPAYPADRLEHMLSDSGARILITDQHARERTAGFTSKHARILDLHELVGDEDSAPTKLPESWPEVKGTSLAYIIYTSGSTGRPKGVMLEHKGAAALINWARAHFSPAELSGVLASTSICFDLSVFEIFVPLACGGKVILAHNALSLPVLPARSQVSLINTVPSAITELLRLGAIPDSAKVINLAGEPLSTQLVDRLYAETKVEKVYDLYGPTETTTYSTFALRHPRQPATIGRPLSNERVYILDAKLQPVPPRVPGELYIGGVGVARGYWNQPGLTTERFVPNPFIPGDRLYRTGDLCRWRNDGTLEYLGRMDHQVKLRGFRIELGEIESALLSLAQVRQAVAMVREDEPGDKRLVAYVAGDATASDLRNQLQKSLPSFMQPSQFVLLPRLPLTPNGKIDRKALPRPSGVNPSENESIAPRNESERLVMDVWEKVLGSRGFSVTDNFFHLGGHSLIATQVMSRLSAEVKRELPLRLIFEAPTVAELAQKIDSSHDGLPELSAPLRKRQSSASRAEALLARLDELSDAEVEELLRDAELKPL